MLRGLTGAVIEGLQTNRRVEIIMDKLDKRLGSLGVWGLCYGGGLLAVSPRCCCCFRDSLGDKNGDCESVTGQAKTTKRNSLWFAFWVYMAALRLICLWVAYFALRNTLMLLYSLIHCLPTDKRTMTDGRKPLSAVSCFFSRQVMGVGQTKHSHLHSPTAASHKHTPDSFHEKHFLRQLRRMSLASPCVLVWESMRVLTLCCTLSSAKC